MNLGAWERSVSRINLGWRHGIHQPSKSNSTGSISGTSHSSSAICEGCVAYASQAARSVNRINRAIREPHQPRERVSLSTRRNILSNGHIKQPRDSPLKRANLPRRPRLVRIAGALLPPKPKDMDKHVSLRRWLFCPRATELRTLTDHRFIANALPDSSSFATASFEVDSV
jgi:hypothetical protein